MPGEPGTELCPSRRSLRSLGRLSCRERAAAPLTSCLSFLICVQWSNHTSTLQSHPEVPDHTASIHGQPRLNLCGSRRGTAFFKQPPNSPLRRGCNCVTLHQVGKLRLSWSWKIPKVDEWEPGFNSVCLPQRLHISLPGHLASVQFLETWPGSGA